MKKGFYLLILLLLCSGCTMFVKAPVVTVRDLTVASLEGDGLRMDLHLSVKNSNPYQVKLLGYSYDLKVMGLALAKGAAREEVVFPAGAETELAIPIRVSYGDLLQILKQSPDPERIPYALQAGLDLETPLGRLSVPVDRTGTYAVPKQYRPASILNNLRNFFK